MRKILYIMFVFLIFSCTKDDIVSPVQSSYLTCPEMYEFRSNSLNMDIYDSVSFYYTAESGCMGMEPIVSDSIYSYFNVNPTNPYEIIYLEKNSNNWLFSLKKYNFCSDNSSIIKDNMINYNFDVSSKGWILFVLGPGEHIYKIKLNGEDLIELPYFPTITTPNEIPIWNPSGEFFISHVGELYNEDGIPIDTIDFNNAGLIGWFNDTHILTSKENNTYKIDINTGDSEVYLTNNHNYYDYNSQSFFKKIDSLGYQKWNIYDNYGDLKNSTKYHYKKSAWFGLLSTPKILEENKVISNLITQEYFPNFNTTSCQLLERYNIIIMDKDGTNVRKVNFPD